MAPSALDLTLGATQVGVLLSSLLYGMSLVQTYSYATNSGRDKTWLKAIVFVVCFLETLHTVLTWMYIYCLSVSHFGNPIALLLLPWYFCLMISCQAMVSALVQGFYIWRVLAISRKWWLVIIPWTGALVRTITGVLITIYTLTSKTIPVFRERYSYLLYVSAVSSAIADIWNTGALCWLLRSQRTAYSRNAINRIMIWAIETGMITSLAAILCLTLWTADPGVELWLAALLVHSKLYSNSLLVSLNARKSHAAAFVHSHSTSNSQSVSEPLRFSGPAPEWATYLSIQAGGSLSSVMPMGKINPKNGHEVALDAPVV